MKSDGADDDEHSYRLKRDQLEGSQPRSPQHHEQGPQHGDDAHHQSSRFPFGLNFGASQQHQQDNLEHASDGEHHDASSGFPFSFMSQDHESGPEHTAAAGHEQSEGQSTGFPLGIPSHLMSNEAWHRHEQATHEFLRQHQQPGVDDKIATQLEHQPRQGGIDATLNAQPSGRNPVANFLGGLSARAKLVCNTAEWKRLERHVKYIEEQTHLRELLQDQERCDDFYATHDGVYLDFSRQKATKETLQLLLDLADRQQLKTRMQQMFSGERINFTEDRAVLHTALRARRDHPPIPVDDGKDAIEEVHDVLDRVKAFTDGVRSGEVRGYTGKRIRNIISVGIGGSYLGPEFLHECLKTEPEGINAALGYTLRFLSNVDPVDVERTCHDLDPEETLIVIVSKTFTTAETMLNARTMRQWMWDFMGNDKEVVRKHFVACASISSADKVAEFGIDTENYFFRFWDWVGGRYSVCSAAGAVPISLLYGFDLFEKFLQGARSMDEHFFNAPFDKNIPVLMGLFGVWNMSFLGYNTRTTLPYAEALLKLPAHIQQLDMESNGKSMTKHGVPVEYKVGEVDFGEPGTNGQHSFYQLLHMGQTVPCDFIGFAQSQHDLCLDDESLGAHDELMANFFAQPDALANGKTEEEVREEGCPDELVPHKVFQGNRPSSSVLLPKATAYAMGQILSMYEHRTAVQGFIWDINSFDQWGVELGKKLAIDVKDHLFKARKQGKPIRADNPASTRLLSYYVENSKDETTTPQVNPFTRVTRKTHKEFARPPFAHNLKGEDGKF